MKPEIVMYPVGDAPPTASLFYGADVRDALRALPEKSVQVVCTSPPYWALRDYGLDPTIWGGNPKCRHVWADTSVVRKGSTNGREDMGSTLVSAGASKTLAPGESNDPAGTAQRRTDRSATCRKCGAWRGQLGQEPAPALYVAHLVEVFREVRRVLRDDGVVWLNLGDTYAANRGRPSPDWPEMTVPEGLKQKDLVGIPWRAAFALQEDGWWLRSDVVWCLSGGTTLYAKTPKGVGPVVLKDLARMDPGKVKLWNGAKWTQVLGWSRSARMADEIQMLLRSGERISCTATHKWPTGRGLLAASELKIGDVLQSCVLPEPEIPSDPQAIPDEAAWFIGMYLAEGSKSEGALQISGHVKETWRLGRIQKLAEFYGGHAVEYDYGNEQHIKVFGKLLGTVIDEHVGGKTAKDKHLKPVCWTRSNKWLRALLDGYLEGDGHFEEASGRWRLGFTRNYVLARDLRTLAARLGCRLVLNTRFAKCQTGRFPTFKGELRFSTSGHWNEKDPNEIVGLQKAGCRDVYDVGVEDDPHIFALASGILTHNSKPNGLPDAATDRPTRTHEYVFLLTKAANYFYDADAVREPAADYDRKGGAAPCLAGGSATHGVGSKSFHQMNPNGRNRRSVWSVVTSAFEGAHFATWPPELVRIMVKAGSSEKGRCPKCGAPWRRVVEKDEPDLERRAACGADKNGEYDGKGKVDGTGSAHPPAELKRNILKNMRKVVGVEWEPTCKCGEPGTARCVVLDPFCGSGTTGRVAFQENRDFVGIDLNGDYLKLAKARLLDERPPCDERDGRESVLDMF